MTKKVISLDDSRPHLTIKCEDAVHVLPVTVIEDVINGQMCFTDIEGWRELIKPILLDWVGGV